MLKLSSILIYRVLAAITFAVTSPHAMGGYDGYLISTHSQYDDQIAIEEVAGILHEAGISKAILSNRGQLTNSGFLRAVQRYPVLLYPVIRTKTRFYLQPDIYHWKDYVANAVGSGRYSGFQEVLLFHAAKVNRHGQRLAPEVRVRIADPRVEVLIKAALDNNWPVTLHYEFGDLANSQKEMLLDEMEKTLTEYRELKFTLMHMGQLDPEAVHMLIERHSNLHFHLSMTANVYRRSQRPWAFMFMRDGETGVLQPRWKALLEEYPNRFLLTFDGVFPWIWRRFVRDDVAEWRAALETLPSMTADLIAHGNAERLWPVLRQ